MDVKGGLIVEILEAKVHPGSGKDSTDPYCTVTVGSKKKKTKIIRNTLNPVWTKELFEFEVDLTDLPEFVVHLADWSLLGSQDLGYIKIKSESAKADGPAVDSWILLETTKEKGGRSELRLRYKVSKTPPPKKKKRFGSKSTSHPSTPDTKRTVKPAPKNIFQCVEMRDMEDVFDRPLPNKILASKITYINNYIIAFLFFISHSPPDEINKTDPKLGNTVLHEACLNCKNEVIARIVIKLLEHPTTNATIANTDGNTAFHFFCRHWSSPNTLDRAFELFMKKGVNINAVNANGETPLFKAIENKDTRGLLLQELFTRGADPNIANSRGDYILHYVSRLADREDLVNLILKASPKLDNKGVEGKTPKELAVMYNNPKTLQKLQKAEDLFEWLESHNLSEYKRAFIQRNIELADLLKLKESTLLDSMDITSEARRKIMEACRDLEKTIVRKKTRSHRHHSPLKTVDSLRQSQTSDKDSTPRSRSDSITSATSSQSSGSSQSLKIGREDMTYGDQINVGEIEYVEKLGVGASGEVFKGIYKGKFVACKFLKAKEKEFDEFQKEYKIMSAIRDTCVVQFLGVAMGTDDKWCMVMEFCERGSLFNVLRDDANFNCTWDRVFSFALQAARGLATLHNNKPQILHRDLKSLNLLVTNSWQIKLADFGLSRFDTAENLDTMKQMRGTLAYCCPEVYYGIKYTNKSDIYSLGIILWEMANRCLKNKYEQPYAEYKNLTFDFQIIIKAAKEDLRPSVPPDCPEEFLKIIRACVHKDPASRPDVNEVIQMLNECQEIFRASQEAWENLRAKRS